MVYLTYLCTEVELNLTKYTAPFGAPDSRLGPPVKFFFPITPPHPPQQERNSYKRKTINCKATWAWSEKFNLHKNDTTDKDKIICNVVRLPACVPQKFVPATPTYPSSRHWLYLAEKNLFLHIYIYIYQLEYHVST